MQYDFFAFAAKMPNFSSSEQNRNKILDDLAGTVAISRHQLNGDSIMAEPAKVADSEALPLRLKWRQTWPDRDADYAADAPGYTGSVGRIYIYDAGPQQGLWFWAMNAHGSEISRNVGNLNGIERSARAAARAVEDAWFAAIKGSSLDRPPPKRNAYAAAKAGSEWYDTRGSY